MRLIFLGTPQFAVPTLQSLLQSPHRVLAVITQPDRPRGRSRPVEPSPVKKIAQDAGVAILQPEDLKQASFLDSIRRLSADCAVVVAYGRILPLQFLELFPKGAINLHASLLPKYRGAAPIQWALIRGEAETGVTLFQLDEQLDHGPVFLQRKTPVEPNENAIELGHRLARLGAEATLETLHQLEEGKATFIPQNEKQASQAPRLTKADGEIPWQLSCQEIHNRIRGMQPWPGAYSRLGSQTIKILSAYPDPARNQPGAAPGILISSDPKAGLWVQTGKGQLRIDRLQPEGGKEMDAVSFLRGHPVPAGSCFQFAQ